MAGEAVGLPQVVEDGPALPPVPHELPGSGVLDQDALLFQELGEEVGGEAVPVDGAEGLVGPLAHENLGVGLASGLNPLKLLLGEVALGQGEGQGQDKKGYENLPHAPPHRTKAGHSSTTAPFAW